MQLRTVRQAPETLVFFLHRRTFLRSYPLFFPLYFFCPAYHLSPFLSKDIHQRNMAPPSPVTSTPLCQLSEPESTDCCGCQRWRRGFSAAAHICLHQDVAAFFFFFLYLSAALNIQQTKAVPRGFPLGRLH